MRARDTSSFGFPNKPGDIAIIATLGAPDRRIKIPINVTITVGQIVLSASQTYTIFGDFGFNGEARGSLVFNSGSAADAEVANFGGADANLRVVAPARLESSLSVNVASTGRVEFISGLSQDSFNRFVTKTGPGTMDYSGRTSYTGTTHVTDGVLELTATNGGIGVVTIEGTLEVGDGIGGADSAKVVVVGSDEINSAFVHVKRDGLLEFRNSDTIGHLFVNDGRVVLKQNRKLAVASVNMIGGTLTSDVGSEYTLDGDFTASPSAVGPAAVIGSATGALHLSGTRSFNVNSGSGPDLDISIPVTGGPSAAFIKDGPGVLSFTGTASNTYGGQTKVLEGLLLLARTSGVAVPGALEIGADSRSALVQLQRNENIANISLVTVASNGVLAVQATETIAGLSLAQGRAFLGGNAPRLTVTGRLETTGAELLLLSGHLVVSNISANSTATTPSVIRGQGVVVATGTAALALDVIDGPQPIDLAIDATIESRTTQGILKAGPGTAQLSANNIHKGPTTIMAGTLVVTGQQPASAVLANGGTLAGTGRVGNVTAAAATLAPGLSRERAVPPDPARRAPDGAWPDAARSRRSRR